MLRLKRNALLFFLIVMSNCYLAAQNVETPLDNAIRFYELQQYPKAIQAFNQLLKSGYATLSAKNKLSVLLKLAYSYKQNKDEVNAERLYRQAFSTFPKLISDDPKAYVNFAQVLANNGKFQEAQEYLSLSENIQSTKNQMANMPQNISSPTSQKSTAIVSNTNNYKIEYLDINTSGPEFSPMYYKDGIVFCS